MTRNCAFAAGTALAALLSAATLFGQVTITGKHRFISVVPVPGKVAIDGKLDDWDLSGEILSYAFPETAERRHARTAMMYDSDNLYVAVYFRDTTPMMNMCDGRVDKSRGWDADCFQLRMVADASIGYPVELKEPKPIARDMMMWYFTGKQEPTISIDTMVVQPNLELKYSFDPQVFFGEDSGLAFSKAEDGYILEGKIPWKRLKMPGAPPAGAKLAMTMQHLWGNDEGTRYATSVNDITGPAGGFTYQRVVGWGYALIEPSGKLAREREELPKELEVAKTLSFSYNLPEAGLVSLGVFNSEGDLVRTLLTGAKRPAGQVAEKWDGLSDFGEVLPAGSYTFKALAHKGITQEWIVSLHNSGNPPWVTSDGKGSWGGDHGVPLDAACSADRVFLLWNYAEAGWNLIGCSPDGRKQWGAWTYQNYPAPNSIATDGKLVYVCQESGVTVQDAATGKPVMLNKDTRGIDIPGGGATDIVCLDGRVYVLARGAIHCIDIANRRLAGKTDVGEAKGLAALPGTRCLLTVRKDGFLARVHVDDGYADTLFDTSSVVYPYDLAVSPDGKTVFISDQGRGQNTIKAFSYPEGKPAGTVGRPGGRPALGKYDPSGVFMPGGIAFDTQGRLWVTEMDSTPKRISVWSPDGRQGRLEAEYFGGSAYSVGVSPDPERPEHVYIHNTRWIVDYEKRTARLDCTFARPGYFGPQPHIGYWMGEMISIRHAKDRVFMLNGPAVWEMLEDHAVPVFTAVCMERAIGWPAERKPNPWAFTCYWSDLNRDALVQLDEVANIEEPYGGIANDRGNGSLGKDMAIEMARRAEGGSDILRLPVKEWRDGLPIWAKIPETKPVFRVKEKVWGVCWNAALTRCYVLETNDGYYTNDMRSNGVACYAPDGRRLWRFKAGIGMDLQAPLTKTGELRGIEKVIGFTQAGKDGAEVVGVSGYYGNYCLLSEDGLFVAELCHDNRRGHPLDSTVVNPEGFGGYLVQHPKTKKTYLYGGDTDGRIWEVKGLDDMIRLQGGITITPKDAESAAKALAEYQKAGGGTMSTEAALSHPSKPPQIDGALDEWDFSKAVSVPAGPGRGGKAMAAYDDKFLYLAYQVADDSAFVNKGTDFAYLFKSGDLVDFILCTNPDADPKRKAGKGDLRLLFAPFQGKPTAIINQKVAEGGPSAPLKFASPGQSEEYDRVAILNDAQMAVKTTPDGYTLEAAVPLSSIGFKPVRGQRYPADFGILYGDPEGARTLLRAYWANRNTSITGDIPTESRIVPEYLGKVTAE